MRVVTDSAAATRMLTGLTVGELGSLLGSRTRALAAA